MKTTTVLIIGAGHCGLAMSYQLTRRSIDHLVLDAGRAGESWRSRRWDSLRLLTPNWMNSLAGENTMPMACDGFPGVDDFVTSLDDWIARNKPPILSETAVISLKRVDGGFAAETSRGPIHSQSVVIATGACALPKIPQFANALGRQTKQLSPLEYRNPSDIGSGRVLVVGASASGLQIARELALAGKQVTLAVGSHGRLPRTYRGADILMWMHLIGSLDEPYTAVEDLERARRTPSLPLMGSCDRADLNLNLLQASGVELVGRFVDIRDGSALFSGGLANAMLSADLKMNRLLNSVDSWISDLGMDDRIAQAVRFEPTRIPTDPRVSIPLNEFDTVIWATGFTPDHRFIQLPVLDRKGRLMHDGGVVAPGLYAMGLPYMRTARSTHISGAPDDAQALAQHIETYLRHPLAA